MLKESTEAILVYENYTHEPKYVLKEQEGCNTAESTALLQIHISEISKKIPQSKYYLKVPVKHRKQTSANEKFTEHLTQENTSKELIKEPPKLEEVSNECFQNVFHFNI